MSVVLVNLVIIFSTNHDISWKFIYIVVNIYLRNCAMTSLRHWHIVDLVLPLTDISTKLLEYQSKWTRKVKIEQNRETGYERGWFSWGELG